MVDVNVPPRSLAAPVMQDGSAGPPPTTSLPTVEALPSTTSPVLAAPAHVGAFHLPDYGAILASFPDMLNHGKTLPPVQHHVQHFIETEGHAVAGK